MNSRLRKDLKSFLDKYYKFELVNSKNPNTIILVGVADIADENDGHWESYKIKIVFNENDYPNVIPIVYELSKHIDRNWDFHISKDGICCLNIPHKLIKQKSRGIELTEFYKDVIYPFFANHQFKLKEEKYANGEYKHSDDGIAQFYSEEFELNEPEIIIKYLELAIGQMKTEANKKCPICGKSKYKKCCRPKVNKLMIFGKKQLLTDLEIFKNRLMKNE
ncbi:MAG: hypothetical protein WC389_05520 [Lutibacter sp.]|jgi:hypothetical protein